MRMIKRALVALPVLALASIGCGAERGDDIGLRDSDEAVQEQGNGIPGGSKVEYQMNLIGVPKGKNANITTGNRIFLPLDTDDGTSAKISMVVADEFDVLDGNATDGSGSMSCEKYISDTNELRYQLYVRMVGKPGGGVSMNTCATDPATGEVVCSTESYVTYRTKGKQTFQDVTKDLLTIQIDIDGDGDIDVIPMFDPRLQDYFWSYDSSGCKNLQVRFVRADGY